jgi:DNA repair protein SbcD/Mre11
MLALHTSDWHLGRALHRHDLLGAQASFVDHLVEVVRSERVAVVLLAGDVHDRALPRLEAMTLFADALRRIRDAGADVVAISGNHDAPARLGDKAGLLEERIQIRTDPARAAEPVVLTDPHGTVAVYAVPYLDPATAPDPATALGPLAEDGGQSAPPTHVEVMATALRSVAADRARRGGRSVVLAHTWVAGGAPSESEREIGAGAVGGIGGVPGSLFDGVTYTALGHLHRPQSLTKAMRYSGSPLPYSFSEAGDTKVSWLVELDADGLGWVEAIPAPAPRRLSRLRGRLDDLMHSRAYDGFEDDFVAVVLTDTDRPLDAMTTLRRRFPYALTLVHSPQGPAGPGGRSYPDLLRSLSEREIAEAFVAHVRTPATDGERQLLAEALADARLAEEPPAGG